MRPICRNAGGDSSLRAQSRGRRRLRRIVVCTNQPSISQREERSRKHPAKRSNWRDIWEQRWESPRLNRKAGCGHRPTSNLRHADSLSKAETSTFPRNRPDTKASSHSFTQSMSTLLSSCSIEPACSQSYCLRHPPINTLSPSAGPTRKATPIDQSPSNRKSRSQSPRKKCTSRYSSLGRNLFWSKKLPRRLQKRIISCLTDTIARSLLTSSKKASLRARKRSPEASHRPEA